MKRAGVVARAAIASAVLSACSLVAAAERRADLEAALAGCAAIADRDQRLACYDAITVPLSAPAAVAAPAPVPTPASPAAPAASAQNFGRVAPPKKEPELASIAAAVVSFGQASNGNLAVRLDNGQSWELEDSDPLLSAGDAVTIRRGALGSFLLTTPAKRTHRVRRIH